MWYMCIPPLLIIGVCMATPAHVANFLASKWVGRPYKVESPLELLGYARDLDDKRILLDWDALPDK